MKVSKQLKVVGLTRVSTKRQELEGESLETQDHRIRTYCELNDFELQSVLVDAESGKSMERNGLQEALRMMEAGKANCLMVSKLSRLTRNLDDWRYLLRTYFSKDSEMELMSVDGSINTRTAMGRMLLNILMSVLEGERELIGERTSEVLQRKIERGEHVGRVPYGKKLVDGKLQDEPEERKIIELAKRLRDKVQTKRGYLRAVCRELNARGYRTRKGNEWKHSSLKKVFDRTEK